ncbi:MAG: hypothetical protein KAJ19_20150 [Gammaproteobacteria bacterium]|nr:hypothetical protein [Gammaproteobacteria bacterium]
MTLPSVSQDIAALLDADVGLGLTSGADLFIMAWDPDTDLQTLIMDTGGIDSDLKGIYEQPTFQVLHRGARDGDGATAYARMRQIHEFLIARPTETINGQQYLQFEPQSSLVGLGRDDNSRHVFSMNYFTFRSPN